MYSWRPHNDNEVGTGFPVSDFVRRSTHIKRVRKRKYSESSALGTPLTYSLVDGGWYSFKYGRCARHQGVAMVSLVSVVEQTSNLITTIVAGSFILK